MKQLIIQVTPDFKSIVNHFEKYAHFFNSIINRTKKYALYLEVIDDGFLFIYPSAEDAKKFFSYKYGEKITKKRPLQKITDKYLLNAFFPAQKFPKQGIRIKLKVIPSKWQEEFNDRIQEYFGTIHEAVSFPHVKYDSITMRVKSVEAIHAYTTLIFNKFYFQNF